MGARHSDSGVWLIGSRRQRRFHPARWHALPSSVESLRLVHFEITVPSRRLEREGARTRASARSPASRRGSGTQLEDLYFESWPLVARWRDGDWIVPIVGDTAYTPSY